MQFISLISLFILSLFAVWKHKPFLQIKLGAQCFKQIVSHLLGWFDTGAFPSVYVAASASIMGAQWVDTLRREWGNGNACELRIIRIVRRCVFFGLRKCELPQPAWMRFVDFSPLKLISADNPGLVTEFMFWPLGGGEEL